jgi:2-polyprenyl-3-methyl-5-hydroxy-6-metoxy-1,4-benzoquinol methylase
LTKLPTNWAVLQFDGIDPTDFLASLDFFVHYDHEHHSEAFGRAPLEAIAAGVPTILPETFSEIFGEAAIYAEPAQVLAVIKRLWGDKEAYAAQVTRGLNFIAANYGIERFGERVRPYLYGHDSVQVPGGHSDRYNGSVSLRAGSFFNAAEYWENRHRKYRDSLRSVGHVNLSEADSQADYEVKISHVVAALEGALGSLEGKEILDAGCGIGLLTKEIVSSGGSVLGVDHSETAVARARAHAPQARFECLSLDQMPYDAIFDAAVSMDVLFHVVDDTLWEASILRMIAAIKPGGFLFIQESFNMPGEAHFPHLRWRNLEDYRRVLAEAGARISTVEAYPIPHECTVKTVLTIECASEAPQLDMISGRSELAVRPS